MLLIYIYYEGGDYRERCIFRFGRVKLEVFLRYTSGDVEGCSMIVRSLVEGLGLEVCIW